MSGVSSDPMIPSPAPTPAEIMADVAKRQLVWRICNAYESGIERGLSGRDLAQPYEPTSGVGIAYENGWYVGRRRHATPSILASALAKLRECVDKDMFGDEVTCEEAAALLARLEAADNLLERIEGVYANFGILTTDLRRAIAAHLNSSPAAEGEHADWCPVCGGKDGQHLHGCEDGGEVL